MARSETIIVGGSGIAPGPNFSAGKVLQGIQVDPPLAGDTKITVTPAGSNALGSFITIPGEAPESLTLGANVVAPAGGFGTGYTAALFIGRNINPPISANFNVENCLIVSMGATFSTPANTARRNLLVIGHSQTLGPAAASEGVLIGTGAQAGVTVAASFFVGVGNGAQVSGRSVSIGHQALSAGESVAVGYQARATASQATAIGDNCEAGIEAVSVGRAANSFGGAGVRALCLGVQASSMSFRSSMAFGYNAIVTAANQLAIGSQNASLDYIDDVVIGHGGDPGNFGPYTVRTLTIRASRSIPVTNGLGWSMRLAAGRGTGNAAGATLALCTPSILGSGSGGQTDVVQFSVLQSTGAVGSANTRWDNVADHAGAAAGTLANAPSAGNPAFWLPVNILGTVYAIPCWAL